MTARRIFFERRAGLCSAVLAVGTFAGYMVGAGRAFGYDASVTMQNFVTGSFGDVFTRQVVYNNHPLFSLVEHIVWVVTGSSDETTMRVAPALFAAVAVGLLSWRIGVRWGLASGFAGGLILAAHPTLTEQRDARGYSLAVMAIVIMGIAVLDRRSPTLFAVAAALGVGAHFYAAVPAVALLAWLWRSGRLQREWVLAGSIGLSAGFGMYAGMVGQMGRGGDEQRLFRPLFPRDAVWELLGGNVVAVCLVGCLIGLALRRRVPSSVLVATAVLSIGIVGPWVMAPTDLYPRFVYYATPALALAVAAAAKRHGRAVAVVAVAAAVAMLIPTLGDWTRDELPNRDLAQVAVGRVCGIGHTAGALEWYEPSLVDGIDCPTVALLTPRAIPNEAAGARRLWPVLCWATEGAELRGQTPADCPEV